MILSILRLSFMDIVDILVVAVIIYVIFNWLRGSSAMNIFIAIILLLVIRVVAEALNMEMLSALMGTVIDVGAIALVVLFQPEIRQFLSRVGKSASLSTRDSLLNKLFRRTNVSLKNEIVDEITDACFEMSEEKTGALIVILKRDALKDIIETGDIVDATISKRLIENIFFKNSPLHDGAMIIGGERIVAARCTLPITERQDIPAQYGMRHKAGIGISDRSDADVIVVSEQTGKVSLIRSGVIAHVKSRNNMKLLLSRTDSEGND